jgi:hypothetical protein
MVDITAQAQTPDSTVIRVSGFHDHLIAHAVVKRAFVELAERAPYLQRLAFSTISEEEASASEHYALSWFKPEEIDCVMEVEDIDIETTHRALDCYVTYKDAIEQSGIKDLLPRQVSFEIFRESYDPPLADLFEGLV